MCPPSSLNTLEAWSSPTTNPPRDRSILFPGFIPQDEASTAAYTLAHNTLPTAILNHSIRVYLYASQLASQLPDSPYARQSAANKHALLFVACVLHDIGCTPGFNGSRRFEVEGAAAAKAHLLKPEFGYEERETHDVWIAIACHTSAHIAEEISPLAYLVRVAVLFDFHEIERSQAAAGVKEVLTEELRSSIEDDIPRLEPEKVLGDTVVGQAMENRAKAPAASWVGIMLRAALEEPGWEGVNRAF